MRAICGRGLFALVYFRSTQIVKQKLVSISGVAFLIPLMPCKSLYAQVIGKR
jgi:hypothetical protein